MSVEFNFGEAVLFIMVYLLFFLHCTCTEFLQSYTSIGETIAAYGGPDWRTSTTRVGENDGNFGPAITRTSVTGSPVVPGSALKIAEEGDQVLYSLTILKGHYQAGVVVDGVFNTGMYKYLIYYTFL